MTTFETSQPKFLNLVHGHKRGKLGYTNSYEIDNEIPYHAREYARPFTYGELPKGFKRSDLNHVPLVDLEDSTDAALQPLSGFITSCNGEIIGLSDYPVSPIQSPSIFGTSSTNDLSRTNLRNYVKSASEDLRLLTYVPISKDAVESKSHLNSPETIKAPTRPRPSLPPTLSMQRKNIRPSVSLSRPVLRKTPSRQEFEEMLSARREQSLRDQNKGLREFQHASIQKDLDELQEKLNNSVLKSDEVTKQKDANDNHNREIIKLVETIDLPDENAEDTTNCELNALVEVNSKCKQASMITDVKRSETPAFPVACKYTGERCTSPYLMITHNSPVLQRSEHLAPPRKEKKKANVPHLDIPSTKSKEIQVETAFEAAHDVPSHFVEFARDSSQYWYKPYMTREEAVAVLRQATPGTFIVRNSTTYKDSFGLVIRVEKPPLGTLLSDDCSNKDALVRHFLLEPTTRGVRLKGCNNDPTFTSLSALVYQHSINPMSLPCKLIIPTRDLQLSFEDSTLLQSQKELLDQGASCSVLYLFSMNMESLTGDEAIRKAVHELFAQPDLRAPYEVHFKVSQNGITLTDNKRRLFFRRHYASSAISHIGLDPDKRFFSIILAEEALQHVVNKTIFAFIAKSAKGSRDNQCHVFCDLAVTQPASAIILFAFKMMHLHLNSKLV